MLSVRMVDFSKPVKLLAPFYFWFVVSYFFVFSGVYPSFISISTSHFLSGKDLFVLWIVPFSMVHGS